jgi:exo-beta-1,3-glucanase (GH17 family)
MSNLYRRSTSSLSGIDLVTSTEDDLRALVRSILEAGIHGVCFSPYVEGQGPGTVVGEAQIRERLQVVQPYVSWIRSFSTTEGNELIPGVAAELGLQTMVGVWIGSDLDKNELELQNGIEIAERGHAGILAVGNEVLLRGDVSEGQLIDYIERAKSAVPEVEVGYVDAYFEFADHPNVTAACDVILANCYPFWEGVAAEHSLLYMKEMYRRALGAANGKKVVISETGWPNRGTAERAARPSIESAMKYFIDTYQWAAQDGIEVFYFSAFDEAWKVDAEGDVGAYWGLWDTDGNPKYV